MKNLIKTASIVTSGILVGALVRKYANDGIGFSKQSAIESIKSVKSLFQRNSFSEDTDNYFI